MPGYRPARSPGETTGGRSGGMHNRQLTLLPERLKRREGRMQAEEAIEIEHSLAWNIDAGPHGVILRLAVRHNNVQTIGRAPLKNHYPAFGARARLSRAPCGAREKAGHRRRSDNGQSAVTKKDATRDGREDSS